MHHVQMHERIATRQIGLDDLDSVSFLDLASKKLIEDLTARLVEGPDVLRSFGFEGS